MEGGRWGLLQPVQGKENMSAKVPRVLCLARVARTRPSLASSLGAVAHPAHSSAAMAPGIWGCAFLQALKSPWAWRHPRDFPSRGPSLGPAACCLLRWFWWAGHFHGAPGVACPCRVHLCALRKHRAALFGCGVPSAGGVPLSSSVGEWMVRTLSSLTCLSCSSFFWRVGLRYQPS